MSWEETRKINQTIEKEKKIDKLYPKENLIFFSWEKEFKEETDGEGAFGAKQPLHPPTPQPQ